jgi:hypothetical protein
MDMAKFASWLGIFRSLNELEDQYLASIASINLHFVHWRSQSLKTLEDDRRCSSATYAQQNEKHHNAGESPDEEKLFCHHRAAPDHVGLTGQNFQKVSEARVRGGSPPAS